MHTSVDDHAATVARLVSRALDTGTERVALLAALSRVAAGDVLSPVDLPLFRNSQMDGYAVLAADVAETPVTLPVAAIVAAAAGTPARLQPGTAVRIMTGAMVPDGADAVVPVEDTSHDDEAVTITRSRAVGEYVRDRGSDLRAGQLLVQGGRFLSSRHLAALAAAGVSHVEVRKRVRIAVLTTGAELVAPGESARSGQVFDANAVALIAAIQLCGAEVTFARRVTDDTALLLAAMDEAAASADLIITSGGISKGDFEVVRDLLEPRGASIDHLAMQPGGPQATATFEGTPVVCFPGNPVSTQVSFEVFIAPLLRRVAGLAAANRESRKLTAPITSVAGKRQFLRGTALPDGTVELASGPGSHLVAGLASADVLVLVPEDVVALGQGDAVEVWHL